MTEAQTSTAHDTKRLDLFVTEACNLGCAYCFAATTPRASPSEADAERAIDWLMRSRSPHVHLTLWGGEPLLRLALLHHTVAYAKQQASVAGKRVTFSMPTNATRLDADVVRWLEAEEVRIFLSIDGDEQGQRTRPMKSGGSSHTLAQQGMRAAFAGLSARRPAVRMTVTPQNAAQQGSSARYFVDEGAHELMIYAAFDQTWTHADVQTYERGQRDLASLLVDRLRSTHEPQDVPVFKAWTPILRRLLDGVPARAREGALDHCGAGGDLVALTVEGELVPCHRFVFYARERSKGNASVSDVCLGSLDRGIDAARAAPYSALRIEDQSGKVRCVDCELFDLCTYGCLAINYATTSRLDCVPHAACELMDAQVRVCREVHDELADDPRYALYLGHTIEQAFGAIRKKLGGRAFADFLGEGTT